MKTKQIKEICKKTIMFIPKLIISICIIYNVCYFVNTTISQKEYFYLKETAITYASTDSMSPAINKNDFLIAKKGTYKADDIIIYETNGKIRISKIIQNDEQCLVRVNQSYYPEKIKESQIIGKIVFKIPVLGAIISFLQTMWATMLVFIGIVVTYTIRRYQYRKRLRREIKRRASMM